MKARKKRRTRSRRYLLMPLEQYKARVTEVALSGRPAYFSTLLTQAVRELRVALNVTGAQGSYAEKLQFKSLVFGIKKDAGSPILWIRDGRRNPEVLMEEFVRQAHRVAKSEKAQLDLLNLLEARRRAVLRRAIHRKWWLQSAAPSSSQRSGY